MTAPSAPSDPAIAPNDALGQRRLKTLLEAARFLGAAMDTESLLRAIVTKTMEVMDAEASSVFLADDGTSELVMTIPLGPSAEQLEHFRIPNDKGIAGTVYQSCETLNVTDAQNDPRFFKGVDKKTGFITRAILCAPLLHNGACLGVLQVLNPRNKASFDRDDVEYFEGYASLACSVLVRIHTQEAQRTSERMEQELSIAKEIQQSFLPRHFPMCACVRVAALYRPARTVGGDFYHVQEYESRRLILAVGDVSGKGVPAALTMARATAELRSLAPPRGGLGPWLTELNSVLARDLVGGRFIALTVLLFDPERDAVQLAACGQAPPLRCRNGRWENVPVQSQLPLGIAAGLPYSAETFALESGDRWLALSDGVNEARNTAGDEFGIDRVLETLPTCGSTQDIVNALCRAITDFEGAARQHDDATCLLADWRGGPPPAEWSIRADPAELCVARRMVDQWAGFAGFDDLTSGQIVLAVDEAAANVIRHAYSGASGAIEFKVHLDERAFSLSLRDYGRPVNPSAIKGRALDELRPGGLGTHLMTLAFNDVSYTPLPDGTRLTLTRTFAPEDSAAVVS